MSALQSVLGFPVSTYRNLLAPALASSPTVAEYQRQSSSYLSEATGHSGQIVVLVAFLCAFICAPVVNALLKCALRCNSRMVLHSSDHGVAISLANTGLNKEAITALPVIVCTATSHPPAVSTDCPICLTEFADGQKMRWIPKCGHSFHMECIDQWLFSHSSCPLCRVCLNLHSDNKMPGGTVIDGAIDSNNAINIVID